MFGKILRILSWSFLALAGFAALALGGIYFYFSSSLPQVDTLADYQPPIITRVLSAEGEIIAEFYRERRIVIPVSRMPRVLIESFVAAEDAHFYAHQGIDFVSIARAAMKNIKAGGIVQGGSTITQQVAKSLLLTPERKFSRKFKEAILAWRMEQKLSKEEILYLYLNQIYLGHGAYGVQAAAENYFDKDVQDLTLAESAMLAGLPQAPSRYSPYRHFARAKERQRYVLGRMVEEGFISPEDKKDALQEELTIHPRVNAHISEGVYFTEQVRRHLEETYGSELLYTGGLEVHTTMNLGMQQAAQRAVRENLRNHDKRQGYRGPLKVLSAEEEKKFLAGQAEDFSDPPAAGEFVEAVLVGKSKGSLKVRIGSFSGEIPLEDMKWASPLQVLPRGKKPEGNVDGGATRLPLGSLLLTRIQQQKEGGDFILSLEQEPLAEGAMVALDPHTGQVRAMVGGFDFGRSQFNRALQARRLPGSAFKPIIYAAALDKGFTPATVLLDTPKIYKEMNASGERTEWKPRNYAGRFYGATSLREALTHSHNVITIRILEDIGVGYAARYARKLGIDSPLARDLTLALGSSAVTPLELASSYSVFANGGVLTSPTYITKVIDRNGRVLESTDPGDFPHGPAEDQLLIRQSQKRVISPETAYLVTNLLESVVRNGTGWRAKALKRPVAAKTGTTNDLKDAWFAGYIPELVTVSWVGYDQERPLGRKETGSRAAAPAWLAFMQEAATNFEPREFPVPDNVEFRPIDPKSGLLAPEDNEKAYIEVFAPGTAPTRYALEENKPRARDFFKMDMENN